MNVMFKSGRSSSGKLRRPLLLLILLFISCSVSALARPLVLEEFILQKRPATHAVSSRDEVAYIIEPRFNDNEELTVDRRLVNVGELFVWSKGRAPRSLGEAAEFVSYSPDGSWLVTAVPEGDAFRFRLFSRDSDTVVDLGWTDKGFFRSGWTSDGRFLYRESIPLPDDSMLTIDTLNVAFDPVSRLVLHDLRTGESRTLDEGNYFDVTVSPSHPVVGWLKLHDFPTLPKTFGWQNWSCEAGLLDLETGKRGHKVLKPQQNQPITLAWVKDGATLSVQAPEELWQISATNIESVKALGPSVPKPKPSLEVSQSFWEIKAAGETLWSNDPSWKDVEVGRPLHLQGEDGSHHWLLLPPAEVEKPSAGYPVVCWVYPGKSYDEKPPYSFDLSDYDPYHPGLFTAKGYAVYLPSILPEHPSGNLTDGLGSADNEPAQAMISAFQQSLVPLEASGWIDRSRLAVAGHSGGGNLSMEIAASSTPITTAMAFSGISDRAAWYLQFPGHFWERRPSEILLWKHIYYNWGEPGQGNMGVPPWENPERWTRNSPVYRADLVDAPLLLVSGRPDATGSQAMFTALERQKKPARFLYFPDEQHFVTGRENQRKLWKEIYKWLEAKL